MMLVPYPCDQILVSTGHILFAGNVNDDLMNAYREVTGGVVVPPRGLQIPN